MSCSRIQKQLIRVKTLVCVWPRRFIQLKRIRESSSEAGAEAGAEGGLRRGLRRLSG